MTEYGMGLNKEQRKNMAAVRKLIKSSEWSNVKMGLELLIGLDDPHLWSIMAEGVSISTRGELVRSNVGEIKKRVKLTHRENVALAAARYHGLLTDLTAIDLSRSSAITDLTPLHGLTTLQTLNLSRSNVIPSPLQGLVNLKTLYLEYSCWKDLSPLQELVNLTTLKLDHARVSDIRALTGLRQLTEVRFNNCSSVRDWTPLHALTSLTTLDLSNTRFSDLTLLKDLPNLTTLKLNKCSALTDLTPLCGLTNLKKLYLNQCKDLTDLSPLHEMSSLTRLELRYNGFFDTSPGKLQIQSLRAARPKLTLLPAHLMRYK